MKTLKKVLCLVLALVMVVGTMAISAAAYTDEISEDYEEAVAVLSAIKVIDGYGDDVFGAKDGVTRAQALAFVVRAMLTRSTANKLNASTAAFADVTDDWAKGVVSYAVAEGMANGWDGKFAPNDPVTGYAMAKFALTALDIEGEYTGANWENNVLLAANKAGLLEGMEDDFDLSANLNREQAAQLAYNMIKYTDKATTNAYVVTKGGKELYRGTDAVTALLMKSSNDGSELELTESRDGSVYADVYGLSKTATTDAFGRTSSTITGNNKVKVVLSDEAVYTTQGPTSLAKLAVALGFTKVSDKLTFTVVEDGNEKETVNEVNKTTEGHDVGKVGSLVEVYKTADKTYTVVVVNTYVAKLAKEDIHAAVKATATKDAEEAYITIDGMNFETDAFKKDDIVLYTKAGTKIQTVEKADYVTGKVTAVGAGNTYIRVDGTKYVKAGTADESVDTYFVNTAINKTATFYLDKNNNIVYATDVTPEEVATDVIYVWKTAAVAAKSNDVSGDNLFNGTTNTTAAQAQAMVIDPATGAITVKTVATIKAANGKYYYANKNGVASETEVTTKKATLEQALYEYATLENGDIVLVEKLDSKTIATKAKKAAITGITDLANSKTVLTVLTVDYDAKKDTVKATSKTITGIANFTDTTYTEAYVVAAKDGVVSKIVAVNAPEAEQTKVNYAIFTGAGETTADGATVAFYGVEGSIFDKRAAGSDALVEGKVYDVTIEDGKLTAATAVNIIENAKAASVDETFVSVGGTPIYFASSVTYVDGTGDSYKAATGLAAEDVFNYALNDKGEIAFVIIVG